MLELIQRYWCAYRSVIQNSINCKSYLEAKLTTLTLNLSVSLPPILIMLSVNPSCPYSIVSRYACLLRNSICSVLFYLRYHWSLTVSLCCPPSLSHCVVHPNPYCHSSPLSLLSSSDVSLSCLRMSLLSTFLLCYSFLSLSALCSLFVIIPHICLYLCI